MDSKKPFYKSKTIWVLGLFLLYSALGFFAVPYFIKKNLTEIVINDLNSQLVIDDISFNPYTISTNITKIMITDNDSTLWFSAEKIHADVNLIDTIIDHVSLSKVHLTNPYYLLSLDEKQLIQYPRLNESPESKTESEFLITVDAIDIDKGSLQLNNQSDIKQLSINVKEIIFHHDSFTTLNQDSVFDLSFITENNDKTTLKGSVNFPKSSFNIQWSADNWTTETLFNVLGDQKDQLLGIINKSGTITANGDVKYSGNPDKLPEISMALFQLSGFANITEDEKHLSFVVPILALNNTVVDLNNQNIIVESVNLDGFDVDLTMDEDNNLISDQLTDKEEVTNSDSPEWTYEIKNISSQQSKLHLNKFVNNQLSTNDILFNELNITGLSNIPDQIADVNLALLIDSTADLKIQSKLLIHPLEIDNNITLNNLSLNKWQAWIPQDIHLEITEGLLALDQQINYKDGTFFSEGWIKLNDLKLLDDNKQQFFAINQLDLKQTKINSETKNISLNNIVLDNAQGTLIVSEDKQLNLNGILDPVTNDEENKSSEDSDWIIDIQEIELKDAQTQLTDKSIKPNYHTELTKVNGSIKGLSSDNLSKANVELSGLLDSYGKLQIVGQINPLADVAYTDLSVKIENLSLENFSSYSGQFLGFPITRGKADFELKYKLNQSLLKGINDLKFKQLKFGDKNNSPDAVSLPLKLAVGLLTDSQGIMDINLPVSGNIDDPEFSYGGIVFKAFFKLITGIVASPFKLLGKLIPGGADLDLSGINFQVGTAEPDQQELVKLEAMEKILKQRPGILLELSGVVNSINDSKAIRLQQLLAQMDLSEKPEFTPDYSLQAIEQSYVSTFNAEKWQQLVVNATKDEILKNDILAENAWNEMLANQNIDGKLTILAKQRAQYIQSQLIEQYAVSVERIFIKPNEITEDLQPQVKFGVGQ